MIIPPEPFLGISTAPPLSPSSCLLTLSHKVIKEANIPIIDELLNNWRRGAQGTNAFEGASRVPDRDYGCFAR